MTQQFLLLRGMIYFFLNFNMHYSPHCGIHRNIYDLVWFGLVWFYGISTIVGYLMPNPLYTYILDIYDLVWLGFMAYQLL